MSDTPRTDALLSTHSYNSIPPIEQRYVIMCDHARQLERELAAAKKWQDAVIDQLVVSHIYKAEHDSDPRRAISELIDWECQLALDPSVSKEAAALKEQARQAAIAVLRRCALLSYIKAVCSQCGRFGKNHRAGQSSNPTSTTRVRRGAAAGGEMTDLPLELQDKAEILAYKNLSPTGDVTFEEWGRRSPRYWFKRNIRLFYFDIDDITGARKPFDDDWPGGPGIYFLYTEDALQYIGMARRISERLGQHNYYNRGYNKWITHYSAIWVPETFVHEVECDYINRYKPPRNLKYDRLPKWPL